MTDINKPPVELSAWEEVLFQINLISCCIYKIFVRQLILKKTM